MLWPTADVFAEIEPRLPPTLLTGAELVACRQLSRQLPAAVSSVYLECRLDQRSQVDFLVLLRSRLGAEGAIATSLERGPPDTAGRRTLALLRDWAACSPGLHDVPFMWLEYDMDARFDHEAPVGSPSVGLERNYHSEALERTGIDAPNALRRALAAVALLIDEPRRVRVSLEIERCTAALPTGGSLIYVSEMNTRNPSVTKLYLSLPKNSLVTFLRAVDWPGDFASVQEIVATYYAPISNTVFVDLSIGERLLPRIGLAFSQLHRHEMASFDPAWQWLPKRGIQPEKLRAIAEWPGDSVMACDNFSRVRRWADIKIVLWETGELEAKAYLGYAPHLPRCRLISQA